jgi:hypothetical protein
MGKKGKGKPQKAKDGKSRGYSFADCDLPFDRLM